jgi:hypothetical protein
MTKPYDQVLDAKHDNPGKNIVKKHLEALQPDWTFVPRPEEYKKRDLLFVDEEGIYHNVEVEDRDVDDWKNVWNRDWSMRFPKRKDPRYNKACEWEYYFQVSQGAEDQGVFFSREALEKSKREDSFCSAGSWNGNDSFTSPNKEKIFFYRIKDGKPELVP